ncbi:hypothetical protein OROHE_009433 [Orobanche hederae]
MNREDKTTGAAHGGVLVELPLGDAVHNFNLEKAVCSHGLFMMAPNHWDPHSKTLKRPLRLHPQDDDTSVIVHVSHPPNSPQALHLRVFSPHAPSPQQLQYLLGQVRRMLRLSEEEGRMLLEFHKVHGEAKERGFGRVFRSPTLFEDMVKCMLLCNCQWSRTLSMAEALCELQKELQHMSRTTSNVTAETETISSGQRTEMKHFAPKTPVGKESKRKSRVRKHSKKLANKCVQATGTEETEPKFVTTEIVERFEETKKLYPTFPARDIRDTFLEKCISLQSEDDVPNHQHSETGENYGCSIVGNFPSPRELARFDAEFLAKRCNLGYRAGRIINLARGIVEGRIQLQELECSCGTISLADYDKLVEKLRMIDGFGPFTCANVLMCMGSYHVVPTDSETIRHLKKVHAKGSSQKTVQKDVEDIYGKYAPFQFLAYWAEVWHFYEEWFGIFSEMPHSSYKLITAANMRPKKRKGE